MDNPNNNTPAGNQQDNSRPKLKKVKRPIRRTPPQMPQSPSGAPPPEPLMEIVDTELTGAENIPILIS